MKHIQLIRQYIWIINMLRLHGKMTLSQLNRKWIDDCVADGNPLPRSTFNRHRMHSGTDPIVHLTQSLFSASSA